MKRAHAVAALLTFALLLASAGSVSAQDISVNFGNNGTGVTERVVQLVALITILSLAPSILVMVTSFTRIVIVLSFVRTALGAQQTPPNQVLVSLALFLTLFVMMPTLEQAYDNGIQPLIEGDIDEVEAFTRTVAPLRKFMISHAREQDLALFLDMARRPDDADGLAPASLGDQEKSATPLPEADGE